MSDRKWTVLVTGCSSGIGRAVAQALHRQGHRCFATARRSESVEDLQAEGLEATQLDVSDDVSVQKAVRTIVDRAGRIDMLINNAGHSLFGPLAELPLSEVQRLFETNLFGSMRLIRAVLPDMAERRFGRIVNVGSMVGVVATPFAGAYCASKAALHMMSEVLRMEVAPLGIDVVVVQPGAVRSSVAEKSSLNLHHYEHDQSMYQAVAPDIERRSRASQSNPMETNEFARRMVEAITRDSAPRVVRLGNGVRPLLVLERLPGSIRDKLFTRQFGLDKLRREQ